MNPGDNVASPRSMTWAPCGIGRLVPASTILSPWTMTTAFERSAFDLPSNMRAALRAIVAGSAADAERTTAESAEKRRRKFFMASDMKLRAGKQEVDRALRRSMRLASELLAIARRSAR